MFPLKKSGSECIRKKITTGAGTTARNGDIDSNGSTTPLLGRVAGTQAVHSISDNIRTTCGMSPHLGSGAQALGQDGHGCTSPLPGMLGPGAACPGWSLVCSVPAPQLQGTAAASPLTPRDFFWKGREELRCYCTGLPGIQESQQHYAEMPRGEVSGCFGIYPPAPDRSAAQQLCCRWVPRIPAPAPRQRAPARHCPARSLRYPSSAPALTAAGALCLLSTSA